MAHPADLPTPPPADAGIAAPAPHELRRVGRGIYTFDTPTGPVTGIAREVWCEGTRVGVLLQHPRAGDPRGRPRWHARVFGLDGTLGPTIPFDHPTAGEAAERIVGVWREREGRFVDAAKRRMGWDE